MTHLLDHHPDPRIFERADPSFEPMKLSRSQGTLVWKPDTDILRNMALVAYGAKQRQYCTNFLFPFRKHSRDSWERREVRCKKQHIKWLADRWGRAIANGSLRFLVLRGYGFMAWSVVLPWQLDRSTARYTRGLPATEPSTALYADATTGYYPVSKAYLAKPPRETPSYYSLENGESLRLLLDEVCRDVFRGVNRPVYKINSYTYAENAPPGDTVSALYRQAEAKWALCGEHVFVVANRGWSDFWRRLGFVQCAAIELEMRAAGRARRDRHQFACMARFPAWRRRVPYTGLYYYDEGGTLCQDLRS
ncbi:hypothetical protein SLS62_001323 [Diatrype stigma]|uniref:Uncharacterized protein n=1 Tax=Diatrype stigma TaxID=117547 RepID=A0AAN9UVT3_9PEZI